MSELHRYLDSPVGPILLTADDHDRLTGVHLQDGRAAVDHDGSPASGPAVLTKASEQLQEYFAGERTRFDLPLAPQGTPFQRQVWAALLRIPFGETRSYGEVAKDAGWPRAARAVGRANACNPLAIVVPCHRVIGASGTLTGYGGGLDRKRYLLEHEGCWPPANDAA